MKRLFLDKAVLKFLKVYCRFQREGLINKERKKKTKNVINYYSNYDKKHFKERVRGIDLVAFSKGGTRPMTTI